jgi:hypothetical protein
MMRRIHKPISWVLVSLFVFYIIGNQGVIGNSSGSEMEVESLSHPCVAVINSVSWNHDSSLALIGTTGEAAYLYDGQDFEQIWNENDIYTFYCNQWSPDGSYALLGSDWRIYKYDGNTFNYTEFGKLPRRGYHYIGIDWKPDGSEAHFIGHGGPYWAPKGVVVTHDGNDLEIIYETDCLLWDIDWKPDGSYALIVGEEITKYNGTSFTTLTSSFPHRFHGISWKPDGSYALLVGSSIWKYDGVTFTELYSNLTYNSSPGNWMRVLLSDVEWSPDGSYALIAGGYGRVYKYDESNLTELNTDTQDSLWDIGWRPDGQYALIVGGDSILRYPSSSGNIIDAIIDIDPDTLNLGSKGRWITCYISLPDDYDVNDIDINTILLEDTIPAEWGDIQNDTLMVKFDRSEVEDMLFPGTYNLMVCGELVDGTVFIWFRVHLFY